MSKEIDYGIVITVDGKELHHSVLSDLTYASISEDIVEHFEKQENNDWTDCTFSSILRNDFLFLGAMFCFRHQRYH